HIMRGAGAHGRFAFDRQHGVRFGHASEPGSRRLWRVEGRAEADVGGVGAGVRQSRRKGELRGARTDRDADGIETAWSGRKAAVDASDTAGPLRRARRGGGGGRFPAVARGGLRQRPHAFGRWRVSLLGDNGLGRASPETCFMPLRFMIAPLAVLLLAGDVLAADDPRAVAAAFCRARLADDEAATLALLTPALVSVIEEAKARSDVIAKATPDEKPPFGDGIPYQAFPDAAEDCEPGDSKVKPGRVE